MPHVSNPTPGVFLGGRALRAKAPQKSSGSRSGIGSWIQRGIFLNGLRPVFLGGIRKYNSNEQSMRLLILWWVAASLRAVDLFMGSWGGVVCSQSVFFLVLIYLVSCFLSKVPIRPTYAPGVEGFFTAVTKLAFPNRCHLSIDLRSSGPLAKAPILVRPY